LTVGQNYTFEWWSNDSGPRFFPYTTTATTSGGSSVALNDNTTGFVAGGLGQYATGSFTADNSTQVITFSGESATPLLNGFELRQLGSVVIPEPSTWMAGFASLLLALVYCRGSRKPGASL